MNQPRGLLFDKDGTLVDAFAGWAALNRKLFAEFQARYGASTSARSFNEALGLTQTGAAAGGILAKGPEERIVRVHHELLGSKAPPWTVFEHEFRLCLHKEIETSPPAARPLGDVAATLRFLSQQTYRLGLATSDTEANARRDLARHGGEFLEFWAASDGMIQHKPDPEAVLRFAKAVGLHPREILVVGDGTADLEMARAAGAAGFVAVLSSTCPAEVQRSADAGIRCIDELPALLAYWPKTIKPRGGLAAPLVLEDHHA